jgi:hypothetical protein
LAEIIELYIQMKEATRYDILQVANLFAIDLIY